MPAATPKTPQTERWHANLLWLLGAVSAIAVATFGTFLLVDWQRTPLIVFHATPDTAIVVDVRGAVSTPGVISLPPGVRLVDAVAATGGLRSDADRELINLAGRVVDGQIIVIPTVAPGASAEQGGRININTASAADLMSLPGIGEVTAARIIAYREEHGPFQSIDDLDLVDGISTATIEGIRDLVTVSGGD